MTMTTKQLRTYRAQPEVLSSYEKPRWTKQHGKPLYMGVELECENVDDRAEVLVAPNGYLKQYIWKRDGSLDDSGAELVTAPMLYEEHLNAWPGLLQQLRNYGVTSFDSGHCGMHVHVSRPLQEVSERICLFFANEQDTLMKFSGRGGACHFCAYPPSNSDTGRIAYDHARWDGHYAALNVSNRTTIEFRIFRGSLRTRRVIGNLQFVRCAMLIAAHDTPTLTTMRQLAKLLGYTALLDLLSAYVMDPDNRPIESDNMLSANPIASPTLSRTETDVLDQLFERSSTAQM